jgi:hypothetical protein
MERHDSACNSDVHSPRNNATCYSHSTAALIRQRHHNNDKWNRSSTAPSLYPLLPSLPGANSQLCSPSQHTNDDTHHDLRCHHKRVRRNDSQCYHNHRRSLFHRPFSTAALPTQCRFHVVSQPIVMLGISIAKVTGLTANVDKPQRKQQSTVLSEW